MTITVQRQDQDLTLITFPPTYLAVLHPATPTTAAQALAAMPDIVAAINGPMGRYCPGVDQTRDYAHYTCGDVETLIYDSVTRAHDAGMYPRRGLTFALKGSEIHVARGERYPEGADFIEQTYPSLVEGGANVASADVNRDAVWRAALGILRDGQAFFAIGVGSMRDFAQRLIEAGAVWAGYLDGGGSTALAVRGQPRRGSGENRRVMSWVVVRSTPRPGTSGPASLVVHDDPPPTSSAPLALAPEALPPWVQGAAVVALTAAVVTAVWLAVRHASKARTK